MKEFSTVVLAPHASHPPMDGASYRSWSVARELAAARGGCYYLAKQAFYRVGPGAETECLRTGFTDRSKSLSALRTILFRTHYLVEKHLPADWFQAARNWVHQTQPDLLYVNFLWAWDREWSPNENRRVVVDTHNYDPEWWGNLERGNANPLARLACRLSLGYVLKVLARLPVQVSLAHVSEADARRYRHHRPDLRHEVIPNGCEVSPRPITPDYGATRKRLYFLGALNLQITLDALKLFAERYWGGLKEWCDLSVYGSGESPEVDGLCGRHGWRLGRNFSDEALTRELEGMHFLILPFGYSAGSKLKLINACGKGIPIIATPEGVSGFESLPPTIHVAREAPEWHRFVREYPGPTNAEKTACLEFARTFSWRTLVQSSGLGEELFFARKKD